MTDHHWNMKPNKGKALMSAKRQLAELVCDAVNLEGIDFTLQEIQTLLEGVTVGGLKVSDQQIALNQANAWQELFHLVHHGRFEISAKIACELHAIAAKEEALEWGKFRSGGVTIAGTDYLPPESGKLSGLFPVMIDKIDTISDIYDQAIFIFLTMARNLFFYDVNKRMGRFMITGYCWIMVFPPSIFLPNVNLSSIS